LTLRIVGELTEGSGTQIAFSAHENLWVTAAPVQFHVWRDQELLYSIPLAGHFGGNPSFSPDGRSLYVGARIFDLAQRRFLDLPSLDSALLAGLPAHSNARPDQFQITGSAWSDAGDALVINIEHRPPRDSRITAKYNGPWKRLLLLNGKTRELVATLLETSTSEEYTAIAINDQLIAAAALSVRVWSRANQSQLAELDGFNVAFRDLRFNSDGSMLAAAAWDGHVALWQTRGWQTAGVWAAHEGFARCVAFHPAQPALATGGGDTHLNVWQLTATPALGDSLDVGSKVVAVAFHPDGEGLTAALEDGRLVLCDYQA